MGTSSDKNKTHLEKIGRKLPWLYNPLSKNREWEDRVAIILSSILVIIGGVGLHFPNIMRHYLRELSWTTIAVGLLYLAFAAVQARVYELMTRDRFSLEHFPDTYGKERKFGMTEEGYVVYHSGQTTDSTFVVEMGLHGEPVRVGRAEEQRIQRRFKHIDWVELSDFGEEYQQSAKAQA